MSVKKRKLPKAIAAMVVFLFLACISPITALAENAADENNSAMISVTVPNFHSITVQADGAEVFCGGISESNFTVERLSEPKLLIRAESGKKIKQVILNDEDITAQINGVYYTLPPIYENKTLTVITEDNPDPPPKSKKYTVKGTVSQNGVPASDIKLELSGPLKTYVKKVDEIFRFENLECGKYYLTAFKDEIIIGNMEFELIEGFDVDFDLYKNELYILTTNQNEVGIDITLNINGNGTMKVEDIAEVTEDNIEPTESADNSSSENTDSTTSTASTNSESNKKPQNFRPLSSPKTGDTLKITIWILLLAAVISCMGSAILKKSKDKDEKKNQ